MPQDKTELDPFTHRHRARLAFHLVTVRSELDSVWKQMNALPNDVHSKAIRYRRVIEESEASGVLFLENANPTPGRDLLIEYKQAKANLQVLKTQAPQIDAEVEKYVQTFIDHLTDDEAMMMFGKEPTRLRQYRCVMSLALRPEKDRFLHISQFLDPPNPNGDSHWERIAAAYQASVTPYTDALAGSLRRGAEHSLH